MDQLKKGNDMTDKTPKKTGKAKPWKPGQSGNPAGRPVGSRNRVTIAAQALLDGQAEALTQRAVELALSGDVTALRLCMERLIPVRKDRPLSKSIKLPAGMIESIETVIKDVTNGSLTPEEGEMITRLLEVRRKAIETTDIEERLTKLEERIPQK